MKPKYTLLAGLLLFATVIVMAQDSEPDAEVGPNSPGWIKSRHAVHVDTRAVGEPNPLNGAREWIDWAESTCDQDLQSVTADPLADLRAELDAMADRIEELEGLLEYEYITKRQDVFVRILDAARVETNLVATDSIQQSSMPLVFRQVNGHGSMLIHHGLVYVPETLLAETLTVRGILTVGETEFPENLPARVLALETLAKTLKADSETKERLPRRSRQER